MLCWLGEGPCCTWRGTDTWTTTRTGPAATSSPKRGSPATSPAQSETSRSGALEINGSLLTEEVYIRKKTFISSHPDVHCAGICRADPHRRAGRRDYRADGDATLWSQGHHRSRGHTEEEETVRGYTGRRMWKQCIRVLCTEEKEVVRGYTVLRRRKR